MLGGCLDFLFLFILVKCVCVCVGGGHIQWPFLHSVFPRKSQTIVSATSEYPSKETKKQRRTKTCSVQNTTKQSRFLYINNNENNTEKIKQQQQKNTKLNYYETQYDLEQ